MGLIATCDMCPLTPDGLHTQADVRYNGLWLCYPHFYVVIAADSAGPDPQAAETPPVPRSYPRDRR